MLSYLKPQSERMSEVKSEIDDPKNNMPAEKFKGSNKFTLILANEDYDKVVTTMNSLPAV